MGGINNKMTLKIIIIETFYIYLTPLSYHWVLYCRHTNNSAFDTTIVIVCCTVQHHGVAPIVRAVPIRSDLRIATTSLLATRKPLCSLIQFEHQFLYGKYILL